MDINFYPKGTAPVTPITFDEGMPFSILPQKVVNQRAQEHDIAMTDWGSPGQKHYQDKIWQGQEPIEAEKAALQARLKKRQERTGLLKEFLRQRNPEQALTDEDIGVVDALTDEQLIRAETNPDTFFSKEYGKQVGDRLPLEGEPPNAQAAFRAGVGDSIAHVKYAQRVLEEAEAEWEKAGVGQTVLSYAKEFVPFHTWSNISRALEGAPAPSFLPGDNVEDQRTWFYGTSLEVSGPAFKQAFKEMYASNPLAAIHYARAFVSYGPSDKWIDNYLLGVGDLSLAAPGVGLIPMSTTKLALKSAIRGVAVRTTRRSTIARATGDVERAAWMDALEEVAQRAVVTDQYDDFDELFGKAFTLYDIEGVVAPPSGTFTPEAIRRIAQNLYTRSTALTQTLIDPLTIERLRVSSQAWEAAQRAAREDFTLEYPTAGDAVMNVRPISSPDTLAEVDAIGIQIGRTSDALPFSTKGAATNAARNQYKFPNFKVESVDGKNWYIEVTKNVDETNPKVRSLLIETNNETPKNLFNTFLGLLRAPNYLVSKDMMDSFLVATHGSSYLLNLTKDIASSVGSLGKTGREEFENFMIWQRDTILPNGERGEWSWNLAHFQQDWHYKFNRLPTEKEADAYFAFRQLHDYDFVVRNLGIYRDKVRQGFEDFTFSYHANLPSLSGQKLIQKAVDTERIEGKVHHNIPWQQLTDWDAGIYVFEPNALKDSKYYRAKYTSKEARETLDSYWKKRGYVVVQLTDFGEEAFKKSPGLSEIMPNGDITFLVIPSKSQKARPLKFQQIPYKAGPRVEPTQGFYLSQENVRTFSDRGAVRENRYYGDRNLAFQQTETDAKKFAADWETANRLFLEGNEPALIAHLSRNLPFDLAEYKRMLRTETNPGGQVDPTKKIRVRGSDQSLASAHKLEAEYTNFTNNRDSPFNLYKTVNLENAMERGHSLRSRVNIGSREAPVWRFEPARLVDPTAAMERSMSGVLQARHLDNLKIKGVERWVQEFGDVIDAPAEALAADPMRYLLDFKPRPGVDRERLAAAKNFRRTLVDFLGLKNDVQKNVDWLKQKLADKVFERFGKRAFEVVEPYLLHGVKDPARRLRSFAFHTKLGLFNPVQLFLQLQTMSHIAGVEGAPRTMKASAGATLMSFLRYGDDADSLALAANRAAKFGYDPQEFIESYQAMRKSGLWVVSGEHAYRDDLIEAKIFKGAWGNFLDKGTFFFGKGERGTRLVAWNAAYLRWREANPGKAFTNQAKTEVLSRAGLLFADMTRASNASWQKGFASVPTQFLSYPVRIMEQMWGKRLTNEEKLWTMFTYASIYGVPVMFNVPSGLWDWSEDIRRYFLENNIDYDESVFKVFMDGIPSVALEAVSGTKFNYAERYGITNPFLREFVEGKKDWREMIFGVSGSIYNSAVTGGNPFIKRFFSIFNGTGHEVYPLTFQDWLGVGSEISTVNNWRNSYNAITAGKYYTRHGELIDEVNPIDGLFQGFMGLTPQTTDDLFTMTAVMARKEKVQSEERKQVVKNMRAAWATDDEESFDTFWRKAYTHMEAGEFTDAQRADLFGEAVKGHEARFYSIWEKWSRTSPEAQERYLKELQKRQQRLGGSD